MPRNHAAILVLLACAIAIPVIVAAPARADSNLLLNGDLAAGSGRFASHWNPMTMAGPGPAPVLRCIPATDGAGELEIDHPAPALSAWSQALYLRPGWYRVSAEVRVEGVADSGPGANVFLVQSNRIGVFAPNLHGTTSWTHVEFFAKEYRWGNTVAISCSSGRAITPTSGAHGSGK